MSYGDLSSELTGRLPGLSGFLADDFISRAYRKIRDARLWSFLIQDDAVICPGVVTAGTMNITQYNNQATANATASAALIALNTVQTPLTILQIRFGTSPGGQIYNITAADVTTNPAAVLLTLDRAIQDATSATATYQIYRAYVAAPQADFLKWISVVDIANNWTLHLDQTSSQFDRWDPQRASLGQAYYLGYYKPSTDANTQLSPIAPVPMYELWPGPTQGQTFYVRYRRRGVNFSQPLDQQPDVIPDELIMEMALCTYAYPFAMANIGSFPKMAKVNWAQLIQLSRQNVYGDRRTGQVGMLRTAQVQDDNAALQSVLNKGRGLRDAPSFPYPIDAAFLQQHLVPF